MLVSLCSDADELLFVIGPAGGGPEFEYREPVIDSVTCAAALWSDGSGRILADVVGEDRVCGPEAKAAKAAVAPDTNGFYSALFRTGLGSEFVYFFRHDGWEYQIATDYGGSLWIIPPFSTFSGTVSAPDGEVGGLDVDGYVGDTVCSRGNTPPTVLWEGHGSTTTYRVIVQSAGDKEGCGAEEAVVRFKIGERFAEETGIWRGRPQELNLTLPAATE